MPVIHKVVQEDRVENVVSLLPHNTWGVFRSDIFVESLEEKSETRRSQWLENLKRDIEMERVVCKSLTEGGKIS